MTTAVYSYTIYHSPNAYLGTVLLRRAIAGLSGVELVRRPIYVPRDRGPMIAELLGVGAPLPAPPRASSRMGAFARQSERCEQFLTVVADDRP